MIHRQRSTLLVFAAFILGIFLVPATLAAQVGYAWANAPTMSRYTPDGTYSYNGAGGRIVVSRIATGNYRVLFERLGRKGHGGGFAEASAYGKAAAFCRVLQWNFRANQGRDFEVNVACSSASGPVDTRFTVLAGWPQGVAGGHSGALPVIQKVPPKPLPSGKADTAGNIRVLQMDINALHDQVNAILEQLNKLAQ